MLKRTTFAACRTAGSLALLVMAVLPTVGVADPGKLFGLSAPRAEPLPVAQAFPFSAVFIAPNVILARWEIQPGHYLYRDKLSFSLRDSQANITKVCWPAAKEKDDPYFGRLEVYPEPVEMRLLLDRAPPRKLTLSAQYQGCAADAGLCYPPARADIALAAPSFANAAVPAEGCEA